ncbi:hypothetical protein Bca4012_056545 [Brassica carinata]
MVVNFYIHLYLIYLQSMKFPSYVKNRERDCEEDIAYLVSSIDLGFALSVR